jgi:transketolase
MNIQKLSVPIKAERSMNEMLGDLFREFITETKDIYILDADLGFNRILTEEFIEKHPGRFVNVGIAEANMIGVACGMSANGKRPFVHSFGFLASKRALDQIYLSGAFNRSSVKIIAIFPGIMADINGGTHMAFEDIAIMRTIPDMTVLEPADLVQGENLIRQIADMQGMVYVRWDRAGTKRFYEKGSHFEIGKAVRLRKGTDVTILAAGNLCLEQAMEAADLLSQENIEAEVLDIFSLKPFDRTALHSSIDCTGALVTVENHSVIGGLGACVASEMAKYQYAPIEMIGNQDEFGEVGKVGDLRIRYGLTATDIAGSAKKAISRKIK